MNSPQNNQHRGDSLPRRKPSADRAAKAAKVRRGAGVVFRRVATTSTWGRTTQMRCTTGVFHSVYHRVSSSGHPPFGFFVFVSCFPPTACEVPGVRPVTQRTPQANPSQFAFAAMPRRKLCPPLFVVGVCVSVSARSATLPAKPIALAVTEATGAGSGVDLYIRFPLGLWKAPTPTASPSRC